MSAILSPFWFIARAGVFKRCHVILVLLLTPVLFAGCNRPQTDESETAGAPTNTPPAVLYVFDPSLTKADPYSPSLGTETVSLLTSHIALIALQSPDLQKAQQVEFVLLDTKGVPRLTNAVKPFLPAGSSNLFAQTVFQPNFESFASGLCKWVATVDGQKKFTKDFTFLPLDESEPQRLIYSRKAVEALAKVFSYYWLGEGDYAYTGFVTNTVKKRMGKDKGPEEEQASFATNQVPSIFLQVKNMTYQMEEEPAFTEADAANKVHYRGKAQFGFGIYRQFTNGLGWSEWQGKGPSDELTGWQTVPKIFQFDRALTMEFLIVEKNGDWIIQGENGDRFLNGRLLSRAASEGSAWDWKATNIRPPRDLIQQILHTNGTNQVDLDLTRQTVPDREQQQTLSWLHGRELSVSAVPPTTALKLPEVTAPLPGTAKP